MESRFATTQVLLAAAAIAVSLASPGAAASGPVSHAAWIGEEVEIEGEIESIYEEDLEGSGVLRHFLKTDEGSLSLDFASPPADLPAGARIRLAGVRLGDAIVVGSDEDVEVMYLGESGSGSSGGGAPPALTLGEQRALVLLVNFQDDPQNRPWTIDEARSTVFGAASDFLRENSSGETWLAGDVYGWYTVPVDATNCDSRRIGDEADLAASAAGVDVAAYPRHVYVFPTNGGCGWSGAGTIGGSPSRAWANGRLDLKVIGHELGHNFGLRHSHALECGTTSVGSSCQRLEYGDAFDIMGNPVAGHLNAFQKERLGWLGYGTSPPMAAVESGGTYTLDPYESASSGAKALRIFRGIEAATGRSTWYYVEYRRAIGFDGFLSGNDNVSSGVLIHAGVDGDADSAELLDMTPASATYSDWNDPALAVGRSFTDPESGVTVSAEWADGLTAGVSVSYAQPVCVRAAPSVSLSPSQSQAVPAGTAVAFGVLVTSNDGAGCPASGFDLSGSVPAGWAGALASLSVDLAPGASASTTLTVTSQASAAGGSYTVSSTATNAAASAYSGSGSATYVVAAASGGGKKTGGGGGGKGVGRNR